MPAYQELTERAQLNEQFRQTGIVLWGNLVIGLVTSLFYFPLANRWLIVSWFGTLAIIIALRFLVARAYKKSESHPATTHKWLKLYASGSLITGLCWCFLGLTLITNCSGEELFILFLALIGLTGGNIATSAYRKRLFFAFAFPALVPTGVVALFSGDTITLTMGAFSLAMFLLSFIAVRRLNESLGTSIALGFENKALIQALEQEKDRLEKTNHRLNQELQQKLSMTKWLAASSGTFLASSLSPDASNGNFTEVLAELWESAIEKQQPLSLVLFQIDGDNHWPENEAVELEGGLAHLQEEICSHIRNNDHFIRVNESEFSIILSHMPAMDAMSLVNRLREKLASSPNVVDDNSQPITLSFGVAGWVPNITQSSDELVTACRRAKNLSVEQGGNQINISS